MKTKQCENPGCDRPPFEYKNPRKKFHDIHCKNQAAYIYKQQNYSWEVEMQKARWKNIEILEFLLKDGHSRISLEQLKIMRFNFNAAHIPHTDEQNRSVFKYGNIAMCIISKNECELFYTKKI